MLKRLSLVVFTGLLGLATVPAAQGQNYRPFGPGRTYHYRETATVAGGADSLYTFRVDSLRALLGGDSLFLFNKTSALVAQGFNPSRSAERINLYGGWMRWNATTGTATFGAANTSVSVELQTRAAIGQSWAFTPTVQARITARTTQAVLGQTDSLLIISLSDGNTLQLSQQYGLVSGPDFTFYLGQTYRPNPPTRVHTLALAGLPEAGLAGVDLRWASLFDLQTGDSLFYRHRDFEDGTNLCIRVTCPASDVRYTSAIVVRRRQLSVGGDSLIVWVSDITTAGAGPDRPLRFGRFGAVLSAASGAGMIGRPLGVYAIDQHPDSLGARPVVRTNVLIPDAGIDRWYAPGLGCVYARDSYAFCCYSFQETRLVGFYLNRPTPTRWGNTTVPAPLAAPAPLAVQLPATLAPNPAPVGAAPALSLHLDQPQAVALTLYDGTGRAVWQQTTAVRAGPQRLPVGVGTALAPGLYRLRVSLADGRQRLLPLVRE